MKQEKQDIPSYAYELSLTESQLSKKTPELTFAVEETLRVNHLFAVVAGIKPYGPDFVKRAAQGNGPNVRRKHFPCLLAYCFQQYNYDCLGDLLSLGMGCELNSEEMRSDMEGCEQDVKDWWEALKSEQRA